MDRIKPTSDLAFKKVFGSEEYKDIPQGLILDFFGIEAKNISIENPYQIETYKQMLKGEGMVELRQTIKDVAIAFSEANFVSEMQVRQTRYFDERALFYPFDRYRNNYNLAGKMIVDERGKPNRYSSLRPVYALNILAYSHFSDEDALRIFGLYDRKREKAYSKELIQIAFFEFNKPHIETDNQKHWRDFFVEGKVSASAPEYIRHACQVIDFANLKEDERMLAAVYEKAEADYDAYISTAYLDGKDAGKAEGKAEGITLMLNALAMLRDHNDPETVAKRTGIPLQQVLELAK